MADPVNSPPHYRGDHLAECIDAAGRFPFPLGNALKYMVRAGRKDAEEKSQDIAKAEWYLRWWFRHQHGEVDLGRCGHIVRRLAGQCLDGRCAQVVAEMHGVIAMEDVERWLEILNGADA